MWRAFEVCRNVIYMYQWRTVIGLLGFHWWTLTFSTYIMEWAIPYRSFNEIDMDSDINLFIYIPYLEAFNIVDFVASILTLIYQVENYVFVTFWLPATFGYCPILLTETFLPSSWSTFTNSGYQDSFSVTAIPIFWNRGHVVVWGFIHVCQNGNILECRRILEEDYTKMDCVISMHKLGGLGICFTITTAGSRNHTGVISRPIFKVDTNWQVTAIFLICANSVSDFLKVFIRDNCENSQINWSECWPSSNIMMSCLQQTVFNPALCLQIKSILSTQNSSRLPFCRPFLSGKG